MSIELSDEDVRRIVDALTYTATHMMGEPTERYAVYRLVTHLLTEQAEHTPTLDDAPPIDALTRRHAREFAHLRLGIA
jgi:hypothetical protein